MAILPSSDNNDLNLKNLLFNRRSLKPILQSNFDSMEDPTSSSSNTERRSVIMPRICYYTRISGGSGHQKVCLS